MSYSSEVLADSPLAWWSLGDASTTMADSSGNGRDGTHTSVSATTGIVVGATSGASAYGGSSGSVVADAAWMNTTVVTAEAWCVFPNNTGEHFVLARDNNGADLRWRLDTTGNAFRWIVNVGGTLKIASTGTMTGGVLYHVVGTYDGTTLRLYVNGAEIVNLAASGSIVATSGREIRLGLQSSGAAPFAGTMDEAAVYGTALSAGRVLAHYDAGVATPSTELTVAGTLRPKTAAFTVATVLAASLAGTLQAKTAAFTVDAPPAVVEVELAGTLRPKTAALSLTAVAAADRTVALAGSLRRKTSAFTIDAQSTVILSGALQRKIATFTTYAVVPVAPAPLPAAGVSVVAASAFGAVTMQGSQAVYSISTATTPRARQQIIADGVDITFLRGVHTPDVTATLLEPLLYGPATLTLPQVSACFEEPGVGELSFLRPGAPVEVHLVIDDVVVLRNYYKGVIVAHDVSGKNLSCELGGEVSGRAALRDRQVPIFKRINDLGRQVYDAVHDLGVPVLPYLGPVTGIEVMTAGGVAHDEHIQERLAMAWTRAGRQWTVMPDEFGVYRMTRKDDETIHGTVFVDDARTVANLRRDIAEEFNRIFVTCVTPKGQRIRFGVYPGLIQGPVPDFPGHMQEGDSGEGVRLLIGRLHATGWIKLEDTPGGYDFGITKAVEWFQDESGLNVTGEVNEATWNALYDLDLSGTSLEWAHIEPAAQRRKVRQWDRSGSGTILGLNPDYEPEHLVRDRTIDLGSGVTRDQAREFARTVLNDSDNPNWVGSITFHTGALVRGDGFEGMTVTEADVMDARELRPGMNLHLQQFAGGILVHVSACEVDGDGIVTATVDTRFRDAMEVWEIIARNKESRNDPSRSRKRKHRSSTMTHDSIPPWDEVGGFNGNDITLKAGWNVFKVVGAAEGTVSRFRLILDTPAEFACAVFGEDVDEGWLNGNLPKPLTNHGGKRWEQLADELKARGILYSAGTKDEPCGYSPGRKTEIEFDEDTDEETARTFNDPTGKHIDDAGFAYRSESRTLLHVAVWVEEENIIPIQRIMWNQLESGA